jgi:hypothetical protein
MQIPSDVAVSAITKQVKDAIEKENTISINGHEIAYKEANQLCQCGHIQIGHVHWNGGLSIPDGAPTYCGFEGCMCGEFRLRNYPTTEGSKTQFERKFERIINLFVTVEIQFGHVLPSDFTDEFIAAVKDARDYCKEFMEKENE